MPVVKPLTVKVVPVTSGESIDQLPPLLVL